MEGVELYLQSLVETRNQRRLPELDHLGRLKIKVGTEKKLDMIVVVYNMFKLKNGTGRDQTKEDVRVKYE